MPTLRSSIGIVVCALAAIAACGGGGDGADPAPDAAVEVAQEVTGEEAAEPGPEAEPDPAPDLSEGATEDAPEEAEATADAAPDAPPDGLPAALPFAFARDDPDPPIPDAEVQAFTRKVLAFLKDVRYFDYVLYTTHGVDASTGKPDWQFWYNEHFRKDGDKVTFYHPVNANDGGHNLHIPLSRVLGDTIAAWLLFGDATAGLAAEKLCKGMTASMLGMVHDADDPLPHLMTRNVVPAWNQEFKTHDGKTKAVDTSGWWSEYERWNCARFPYADNPHWGPVWVTNLRSKDDVPHVFRLVPILRYAAEQGPAGATRDACVQTLDLLTAFAKDIVDQDYRIRTKDADGVPFAPGYTGDAEKDATWNDIATFTWWRDLFPEGECNARRGAELIAYHAPVNEDCGRGEPNFYDDFAWAGNGYNKRICRYFHLAHLANALVNRDAGAELLMDGLDERIEEDEALSATQDKYTPAVYHRDLVLYLAQSHAYGYPLKAAEARGIVEAYGRAVDELSAWPYWDPWAPTVPDGDLGGYRPPSCEGEGDAQECWLGVEDLAQVFETCWSPFVNPASARWVDCDIVRDPAKW
jgi:hypothetical protein